MNPAERNPLDLNNLPDDYSKQHLFHEDASSSGGYRRKKKDGKDDGKVYECRFCSLKFCKSQALGGHMNRHRQERETEMLNRARQLVFNNDNLAAHATPHLSCQPMTAGGCYHPGAGDPTMSYRPLYPPRLFPGAGAPTPPQPVGAPPPQPPRLVSYPPQQQQDYYVGHVLGSEYTCLGAPVGRDGEEWGRSSGQQAVMSRFQDIN